jgi:hypothetical protein
MIGIERWGLTRRRTDRERAELNGWAQYATQPMNHR